nr:phage tail protein [Pseudomonas sp. Irchel 3F5]
MATALGGKADKAAMTLALADKADKTAMASALADKADKAALVLPVVSVSANKSLSAADLGVVLVDATAGAVSVTLPPSNVALGVRDVLVRRVDNSANTLLVRSAGGDKIKFHTHLRAEGYSFFPLLGRGDFWFLRSDGAGGWYPLSRLDEAPLGRVFTETTLELPPGGYGTPSGSLFARDSWPWLWDFAQQSGMLVADNARVGMEGCWTTGDGASTFRCPEMRGEHVRIHDGNRGVDVGRVAGSWAPDQIKGHGHTYNVASANTGVGGTQNPIPTDTPGVTKLTNPAGGDENLVRTIALPARLKLI